MVRLSGDHEFTFIVPCPPNNFTMDFDSPPPAGMRRSSTFLLAG